MRCDIYFLFFLVSRGNKWLGISWVFSTLNWVKFEFWSTQKKKTSKCESSHDKHAPIEDSKNISKNLLTLQEMKITNV